jgi:hypothetical protein
MQDHPAFARRMFDLFEPICLVNFFSEEPHEEMAALGFDNYWDGYFAGRSAPLGRVPAEVVDALFYSFGPGEVARHLPRVWDTVTPEEAYAARERGCVAALRRILGDLAGTDDLARAADLLTEVATAAPLAGHAIYAALRSLPVPEEPVARLWHAADLLREHRGDGHVVALVTEQVGGTEAHVLSALAMGIHPAESFGRIHHLPKPYLAATMAGLRARGVVDQDGRLTEAGRARRERVEALTDALAAAPYAGRTAEELDRLAAALEPISAAVRSGLDLPPQG